MTGKITLAIASLGCVLLAGCASSGQPNPPQVVSSTGAAKAIAEGNDKDVVCVQQHNTGSHLAHVVCTTRQEREANKARTQRAYQQMQRSGPSCKPNGC